MAPSITKAPVEPLVVPSRKHVIKSHVLYQGVVAKVIEGLDLIDDCELVNLPQGVIPPFKSSPLRMNGREDYMDGTLMSATLALLASSHVPSHK